MRAKIEFGTFKEVLQFHSNSKANSYFAFPKIPRAVKEAISQDPKFLYKVMRVSQRAKSTCPKYLKISFVTCHPSKLKKHVLSEDPVDYAVFILDPLCFLRCSNFLVLVGAASYLGRSRRNVSFVWRN